jgi:hypothetical protein
VAPVKKSTKAKKQPSVHEKRRHQLFMKRSYQMYRDLEKRFNVTDDGLMRSPRKRKLPFALEQLRDLVRVALNEQIHCPYLPLEKLSVKNFSLDHKIPVSRGGRIADLGNLLICSKSANLAKGEMTSEEFGNLVLLMQGGLEGLPPWPPASMNDVIGRLKAGAAVKRLRFLGRK